MSTDLSDRTGPAGRPPGGSRLTRRRKRQISRGIQYAVFVAVIAAIVLAADWGPLTQNFFNLEIAVATVPDLLFIGLKNTIIFTISGYVLGFVGGLVLALMRLSSVGPYRWFSLVYIETFRGLPLLLLLLMFGFGIRSAFPYLQFPLFPYDIVAITLGVQTAAYLAEIFRAGIQAVPKGQMEAARSLGMSYGRAMVTIIIPQAMRIVVPPLTNQMVLLFKDSSLVYVLGVTTFTAELTKVGGDAQTNLGNTTPLVTAGVAYLLITVPMGFLVRRLEARQARAR